MIPTVGARPQSADPVRRQICARFLLVNLSVQADRASRLAREASSCGRRPGGHGRLFRSSGYGQTPSNHISLAACAGKLGYALHSPGMERRESAGKCRCATSWRCMPAVATRRCPCRALPRPRLSFLQLRALCEREPLYLRLASLARVATITASAPCGELAQPLGGIRPTNGRGDPNEPFLASLDDLMPLLQAKCSATGSSVQFWSNSSAGNVVLVLCGSKRARSLEPSTLSVSVARDGAPS